VEGAAAAELETSAAGERCVGEGISPERCMVQPSQTQPIPCLLHDMIFVSTQCFYSPAFYNNCFLVIDMFLVLHCDLDLGMFDSIKIVSYSY
jgi:hypothetical protein